ncbi:MAG: hypothetical protein JEZ12_23690 [Desulfobacterium sp.]|nr:hypothetical protein [Desulfobacterium sp.]
MKLLFDQLHRIDNEIAGLEISARRENDPDRKVAYMKQITVLKQKRGPLHYETLSEDQKYKHLEGMYAMHSKMASDSRSNREEIFVSFYAKAYALDSRCDRFFPRINKTFNIDLKSQPELVTVGMESVAEVNNDDQLWGIVAKHKGKPSIIDVGDWIGKGAIYSLIGLGIFFQSIMVVREGIKGFGFTLFFLIIATPVYGYGVWKGRQQVDFYKQLAQSVGLQFSSKKGAMPLFLYHPFLMGTYKGNEFTLRLHQTRLQGYTYQKMITESLLEVTIPPIELKKPLHISLNLNKTDPKWVAKKKIAIELIGQDLLERVLASQKQGAIKWEIKINRETITYAEFGPISNNKMIETFRHAFDLLAMVADAMKTEPRQKDK